MSQAEASSTRVWRPRRACPLRNCQGREYSCHLVCRECWKTELGALLHSRKAQDLPSGHGEELEGLKQWGNGGNWLTSCGMLWFSYCSSTYMGPGVILLSPGASGVCSGEKGFGFNLGLRKVCRCPLGSDLLPCTPGLRLSPSSPKSLLSLRLVGQMICAAGQCGQVQKSERRGGHPRLRE